MKYVSETGRIAYKYHVFGWHITISNTPVRFKQISAVHQTVNYREQLRKRRQIAQDRCERCGRDLTIYGRMFHLLPAGAPERNEVDNIRFICNSCYKAVKRYGAPLDINNNHQKGGEI